MDVSVLVVEDDANNVLLLQIALEDTHIACPVNFVSDGQQALDYLAGKGQYADRTKFPMPSLVLLDLKLPLVMGLDVLAWIRRQPSLLSLRVVIFSSSKDQSDITRAHELGADAYFVKPFSMAERRKVVKQIDRRFLDPKSRPGRRAGRSAGNPRF
jgi:CheY-like chemotaxis protein